MWNALQRYFAAEVPVAAQSCTVCQKASLTKQRFPIFDFRIDFLLLGQLVGGIDQLIVKTDRLAIVGSTHHRDSSTNF